MHSISTSAAATYNTVVSKTSSTLNVAATRLEGEGGIPASSNHARLKEHCCTTIGRFGNLASTLILKNSIVAYIFNVLIDIDRW